MGKLLKLQLKENLKILIWVLVIPIILSAGFLYLNRTYDNSITDIGMGLSIILLFLGLGASGLIVLYEDYQRFFGKEAIFYQSLPVSPTANIWSRFFTYLISFIMIFIVLIFDLSILGIFSGSFNIDSVKEVFRIIFDRLGEYPKESLIFITIMITSMITSIFMIIFSINVGSQKSLKSMGIFGPILIYILTSILLQVLSVLTINFIPSGEGSYLAQLAQNHIKDFTDFMNIYSLYFYTSIGVNILLAAVFGLISKYSQDKKLSVG
ncbi:MAG: hypothetical protein ACTIH2_02835 [Anaerococcus sp.]